MATMVCMKLHNNVVDHSVQVPHQHYFEDVREGDVWGVYANRRDDYVNCVGDLLLTKEKIS